MGFASLRLEGGKVMILQDDNPAKADMATAAGSSEAFYRRQVIRRCAHPLGPYLPAADC